MSQPNRGETAGPVWGPLQHPIFRALWIASVASNLGTWMHSVGAVWLMTSLSPSPLIVALVQTAGSLPIFFLSLPAGALADVVDRRLLLLYSQGWMLFAATGMGILTLAHAVGPWSLLFFTFLLGLGGAMNGPAWQAIMPELVPRAELAGAITLNGAGWNIARAVGPAIGGILVAISGPAVVFLLNAASFVGVMIVLYRWKRRPRNTVSPAERMMGAMRAGVRYTRHAPEFLAVLVRTAGFVLGSSALWALLPIVARQNLHLGPGGYGGLQAALGVGAVTGAILLPRLRTYLSLDVLIMLATVVFGLVTAVPGFVSSFPLVCLVLGFGGVAWTAAMSSLNVAAQITAPGWVRARTLGIYSLVFQGGMALASALWGAVAEHFGVRVSLTAAAISMFASIVTGIRFGLHDSERLNLARSRHWPDPVTALEPDPEHGPVMITASYQIDPDQEAPFLQAMNDVARARRRSGAMRWGLFRDLAEPGRYLETFIVESWAEHLRQHERTTVMDQVAEDFAVAFHLDGERPRVEHFIYAYQDEKEEEPRNNS